MTSVLLGKNNLKKEEIDQILLSNKTIKNSEDETHTFLAFTNLSEDDSERSLSISEKGLCKKSRKVGASYCTMGNNNCMGLYLMLTMVLLGVSVLCLELYRTHEAYTLRVEVDGLKKDVENLKHRLLEEDILSGLKAFEDAVYAEEATEDSEDDDDEYDYVEQEDPVSIASDTHNGKHHTSSNTKYEQLQTGDNKIVDKHDHKHKSHDKKKTDALTADDKRSKREVYDYERGVPVIAESYGIANKTEGLRLYESLVANTQEITYETTENPIKEHHRVSSSWPSKQHRKKYHAHRGAHMSKDGSFSGRQRLVSTQPPSPIISRPSRVMQTDKDPSRRVHHVPANVVKTSQPTPPPAPLTISEQRPKKNHEGEILVRVYQEQRAPPESTVRAIDVLDAEGVRRRRRPKPVRKLSSIETLEERPTPVATRHRLLPAAHYNGDTSQYTVQHEHYDGNGRLRHPDGVFTDWTASKWVEQLGMDRHFRFEGGVVNVKDTGLYFVYAQIHYLDEHDINGYRVYVNEEPMLQCTTMTHSIGRERVKKSNTCFTASALFLKENDQLSLRDIGGLRYSLFEAAKSFFGLIKLGSVNIK